MKPLEIGKLATEPNGKKDAIHVPVVSVTAGEDLEPGEMVTISRKGTQFIAYKAVVGIPAGIVDPFLKMYVSAQSSFWLFLQPGSVNDLRHEWDTTEFPDVKVLNDQAYEEDSYRGCY